METEDYNPYVINFDDSPDDEELKIFSVKGFGEIDSNGEENSLSNEDNFSSNEDNFISEKNNSFSEENNSFEKKEDFSFDEKDENVYSNKEDDFSKENIKDEDNFSHNGDIEDKDLSGKSKRNLGPIKEAVYLIEVEKIKPNSQQPRRYFHPEALRELADSIREYGILQPIIVVKIEKENSFGMSVEYEIIAGERRWRAAQLIGLERVPAIVRSSMEERQKLETAIIENVQRQDLNPIETSRSFAKLSDEFGLAQREIAQKIGISRESVSNSIRLLQLSSEAQRYLMEGKISESHARVILTISNPEKQRALLNEILDKKLTVRDSELLAKNFSKSFDEFDKKERENEKEGGYENRAIESSIVNKLEEILGTKVNVKKKGERGKITINFFSDDELVEILKKIIGEKSVE